MPQRNYVMLPYEVDSLNNNSLPVTQMACMEVFVRDILISALQIRSTAAASANFVGAGLYDVNSLALVVGFNGISFNSAVANRSVSLARAFQLRNGIYIWAAGATSAGISPGVIQPDVIRAASQLFGRSPVGVQVDANGNVPGNLVNISQVGAVTQMLVGILLGS